MQPHHIESAKNVFEEFDRKEQDVEVLQELRQLAQERFERIQAAGRTSGPVLWIKIMEAKQHEAAHRQAHSAQHFSVKAESEGQMVCSAMRAATEVGRICWQETLSLPMPDEEQGLDDTAAQRQRRRAVVRLEVLGEHGEPIGVETVPITELRDHQKAVLRTCNFQVGWQLSFALQLVYSPSRLLHSHVVEFDAKLKQARSELLVCEEQLRSMAPPEVFSDRPCVD